MEKKTAVKEPTATEDRLYIGARIEKSTKDRLEAKAKWARRSLSAEISVALEAWVKLGPGQ